MLRVDGRGRKKYFRRSVPPPTLRPYQAELADRVRDAWAIGTKPLLVLPTGAGKTVILARLLAEHRGAAVAVAHRRELVGQISLALTREGVPHQLLAPAATIRQIVRSQTTRLGACAYRTTAPVTVASVDSFHRAPETWRSSISLAVLDEAHHVLRENKWGRALSRLPSTCRLLGVTATPVRADGRGLGARADGVFTTILSGPSMRELIDDGYLAPYKLYAPTKLDLSGVRVGSTGDYSRRQLSVAVGRARITGDVVRHYLRHARGRKGVTFAVGVDAAYELARAYQDAGVPAVAVHAKTPAAEREAAIDRLERGEILQIVNVDLFGEGFDLPAIDCVSMARPTKSYGLYAQQFGRALRTCAGKAHAIIIDHANNVAVHNGPPDWPRDWTLDARCKRKRVEISLYRTCTGCTGVYRRHERDCPYCGGAPPPAERSSPAQVEGDLELLDRDALARLYGEVERVDRSDQEVRAEALGRRMPSIGVRAAVNRHRRTRREQKILRSLIEWWAGVQHSRGLDDRESMRRFFRTFGVDVLTAKTLKAEDARTLQKRIFTDLPKSIRNLFEVEQCKSPTF